MKLQAKTRGILLAMGLGAAGLAQAGTTYTYTYDYTFTVNNCTGNWYTSCGLTGTQTSSSVSPSLNPPADPNAPLNSIGATAKGWANTGGNSNASNGAALAADNQTLQQGHVQAWSGGLGVRNKDYYETTDDKTTSNLYLNHDSSEWVLPEHAVDNDQRYDSILYSFNQAVSLTKVSLSWNSGDSDITILAFTGNNFSEASNLGGLRYDQLLSNGWSRIGHYNNVGSQTSVNTAISSSYWLIGAANPLVGGTVSDTTKDHVKIAALGTKITTQHTPPNGVPEPGTLALFGLGALLLARARARKS